MSDIFSAAAEDFASQNNQGSTSSETTDLAPSTEGKPSDGETQALATQPTSSEISQAIMDLEKMDKFKLDGQEWTLKDLKAAIMRQKDYTTKTTALSEERKSLQEEKKFHENLAWDLVKVKENPALAQEFVRVYPKQFHKHVEEFLKNNPGAAEQSVQGQKPQPQVDVQLLSRIDQLEKFYTQQEVARHEKEISTIVDDLSKKYPNAGNFRELVLGRAYEARMSGVNLAQDEWEKIFKDVDQEVDSLLKAKYGSLVKEQTAANAKAKDVGAGGGTAGRAPVKFKKIDDLIRHGEELTRGAG